MKTFGSLLLLLIMAAGRPAEEASFARTWEGKFKDKVFARIVIKDGDPVSGTLSFGDLRANDDGELIEVGKEPEDVYPMLQPKRNGDVLSFSWDDGDGVEHLELKLLSNTEVELKFVSGPAVIKPLRLRRAGS